MTHQQPGLLAAIETHTGSIPNASIDASIIWLHGLGADGHDFEGVIPALELDAQLAIRFIFPHAPQRAVTINNGMVMPAWYDIYNDRFVDGEDAEGIKASSQAVSALIQREIDRGIDSQRIILAGFSQGGAIALHCGLNASLSLAGILALSTYLPLAHTLPSPSSLSPPILMAHGQYDTVVPLPLANQSYRLLSSAGYNIEWQEYPIEHSVSLEELAAIGQWINTVLANR